MGREIQRLNIELRALEEDLRVSRDQLAQVNMQWSHYVLDKVTRYNDFIRHLSEQSREIRWNAQDMIKRAEDLLSGILVTERVEARLLNFIRDAQEHYYQIT